MLLETHWELTHRAGVLRDNNHAVIPKRTALLWSQRHHSFVDDREMKWNWLPENVRHKPGLEMIFAENTVYKTVRKIKFPLVKNREKPLEKSFWASQTYLTYVLVIFEAMFLLFPFQIFYTFFLTSFFPSTPNSVSSNTVFGQNRRAQAFLLADSDRKEQLRYWNAFRFSPCLSKYLCSSPFQLPGRCAACQPTTKDNTMIPHFFLHAILLQDSGFGNNHWQLLLQLHRVTEIRGILPWHFHYKSH